MIVIPVSHSPKLLAETEKDNVAGLDEELPLPPLPLPPARAATPTAAIIPDCVPANPIFDTFFGFIYEFNIHYHDNLNIIIK